MDESATIAICGAKKNKVLIVVRQTEIINRDMIGDSDGGDINGRHSVYTNLGR